MSIFSLFKRNKEGYIKGASDGKDYLLLEKDSLINDKEEAKSFEEKLQSSAAKNKCPYCQSIQKENISEDISCSFCHKNIRVTYSYLEAGERLVLSEDDYLKLTRLRENFNFYKKVSSNLYGYGVRKKLVDTVGEGEPLAIALKIYDKLLGNNSVKKKYDFLSLAYYQISNIEKFQGKDSYIEPLLKSMYYDYLFGYDLNFLMNEANLIKVKGFIPFVPDFLPAKLEALRNSNKSIEEIENIFNGAIREEPFREDCLKSIIEGLTEEVKDKAEQKREIE